MLSFYTANQLIELRDNFELFKEKHAKNQSYIAAIFAHRIILFGDATTLVLAEKETRTKIREEIIAILKAFGALDQFKVLVRSIERKYCSRVLFRSNDVNNCRGMSLDMLYWDKDESELLGFVPWMVPTEYPNLYKSNYSNARF